MTYTITGYQPERLFHFFEEISAIPRGSSNEKGISDYLVEFAKARGLWCHQDELYNVVIKKPASAGAEDKPAVMLQGHLDMVCEKLAGVAHDFEKDGIDLIVQDGVVTANGTTLGGDNGAAVALMMTVLDDDSLTHPALECVFTTQEETGLTGASGLDKSLISARTMINLDSEEEGIATVSCAGGMRFTMTRPVTRRSVSGKLLRVSVAGLLGGHSGTDIDKERQNGIILLARLVFTQSGNKAILNKSLPCSRVAPRTMPSRARWRPFWYAPRPRSKRQSPSRAAWPRILPTSCCRLSPISPAQSRSATVRLRSYPRPMPARSSAPSAWPPTASAAATSSRTALS